DRAFENAVLGDNHGDVSLVYLERRQGRAWSPLERPGPVSRCHGPAERERTRDCQAQPKRSAQPSSCATLATCSGVLIRRHERRPHESAIEEYVFSISRLDTISYPPIPSRIMTRCAVAPGRGSLERRKRGSVLFGAQGNPGKEKRAAATRTRKRASRAVGYQ